jgi:hypothetical protein
VSQTDQWVPPYGQPAAGKVHAQGTQELTHAKHGWANEIPEIAFSPLISAGVGIIIFLIEVALLNGVSMNPILTFYLFWGVLARSWLSSVSASKSRPQRDLFSDGAKTVALSADSRPDEAHLRRQSELPAKCVPQVYDVGEDHALVFM